MTKINGLAEVEQLREIKKQCAICGKDFFVKIFPDEKYFGGNYFGDITTGELPKPEYWECNQCYN